MPWDTRRWMVFAVLSLFVIGLATPNLRARRSAADDGWRQYAGTIQRIDAKSVTLKTNGDVNITALIQIGSTRIFRAQKDRIGLERAQLQDLRAGDPVMVIGRVSDDAGSVSAFAVILLGSDSEP